MLSSFYAVIGMCMLVAAIFWYASPRSRHRIKRLAVVAALIALALAIAYNYSEKDSSAPSPDPSVDSPS